VFKLRKKNRNNLYLIVQFPVVDKGKTLAGISRYVRKSPKWYYFVIPVIIIFLIDGFILRNFATLSVISIMPFVLFVFIDYISIRFTNKKFNNNRIMYLDFTSLGMATLFFWVAVVLNSIISMPYYYILALAIAFPAFLRFLALYVYYPSSIVFPLILSMNYTFSYIVISLAFYDVSNIAIKFIVPLIAATLIYVAFSYMFLLFTTLGFTRKYKSRPSELIDFFLNRDNDGDIGEKFFSRVYNKKKRIPVITTNIKRDSDDLVTIVFPYVHPGPFGNLCTSNLPLKLSRELGRDNIMVFHTATTNSNNCSGKNDIKNIAGSISHSLERMEYGNYVSDFIKFNVEGYDVSLQKFGNSGISAVIPYGKPFDDISMEAGFRVMKALSQNGAENFALLDAQNSFTRDAEELTNCDMLVNPLIEKFKSADSKYPAIVGYARNYQKIDGLASMGVQAIVLKINDYYNAIVLTDSNNISREIIKMARAGSDKRVKNMDIYTTDNHVVNVGELDINPLGMHCDPQPVAALINKTVSDAIKNAGPATVGTDTEYINVTMGEENTFHNLMQTVLASIRKAKYSIAFILIISIFISVLSFRYIVFHL
jgi:putative membrane protein